MSYCKVNECRYRLTHVTKGHKCGRCGMFGHGLLECLSWEQKENLKQYHNEVLEIEKRCTVDKCDSKLYHTKEAHTCYLCNMRDAHSIDTCSRRVFNVKCPICREDNIITNSKRIFGLTDKCCVCIENNVEILFPTCYHCCICIQCLRKM